MDDRTPARLPVAAPDVPPPPVFVERRVSYRRESDRIAHEERLALLRAGAAATDAAITDAAERHKDRLGRPRHSETLTAGVRR